MTAPMTAGPRAELHPRHVRTADAMRPGVITCAPDEPLDAIAALMAGHRIHCVAVRPDAPEGPWAIATARDVVAAAAGGEPSRLTAAEVAATEDVRVSDASPLSAAMQLMTEHDVDHLVVVAAASGRPVGVLSTLDVMAVLAGLTLG